MDAERLREQGRSAIPSLRLKFNPSSAPPQSQASSQHFEDDGDISPDVSDAGDDSLEPYFNESGEFVDPSGETPNAVGGAIRKKMGGKKGDGRSDMPAPMATKPKRMMAHTVTSKTYVIPPVRRDELGKPILPLQCGIMMLHKLGRAFLGCFYSQT
jgi:hypothetical protein